MEPLTAGQYLDQLPPKVKKQLEHLLNAEERLLWAEWSGIRTPGDIWRWLGFMAPGFVKGISLISLISLAMLVSGFFTGVGFLLVFGIVFSICLGGLLGVMWFAARRSGYALTDQRAIIFNPTNTKTYSDIDPAHLKIVDYAPDFTCFYLGKEIYKDSDGDDRENSYELIARSHAAHLKQLLEEYFGYIGETTYGWPETSISQNI